ncbi:MAG: GDP-mannose 4,6-dehydratase [Actinomycetota bacterium]
MKALITGAGGFVGPHLTQHLSEAGDDVIGLDLSSGPDLLDADGWVDAVRLHEPDVIYHLAGWSDVSGSWRDPLRTFQINALGTQSVLEAAVASKTEKVVLISSADVYGTVPADEQPITEDRPAQPRSPYGVSKQAAEALGQQYHRGFDLDVVIVRPFTHLGVGQSPQFAAAAFAAQVAEAELAGGGRVDHGNLSARRDLTDVRDVVRAYRLLATDGEAGEVYNVCSGQAVSIESVLATLVAASTVTVETQPDEARMRPVDLPVLQGSNDKLRRATGWEPVVALADTLTDVLDDARRRTSAQPAV